jgi:hypothetical protein
MCIVGTLTAAEEVPTLPGWTRFDAHLNACTQQHGYTPAETAALGPHELGSSERAWRECVYAGIREFLQPASPIPEVYDELITTDRSLTDAVAAREITRAERRQRLKHLVKNIELSEQVNEGLAESDRTAEFRRGLFRQQRFRDLEQSIPAPLTRTLGQ